MTQEEKLQAIKSLNLLIDNSDGIVKTHYIKALKAVLKSLRENIIESMMNL